MTEDRSALHVFLVAGEELGDRLGAALMRALKAKTAGRIRFSGVGGALMTGEGLASLFTPDATAIMGFVHRSPRIGVYLRRIREAAASVVVTAPDVLVIIDSPEFTHRIAKRVRRRAPHIPIVDYVCPSVWAWRPWRARDASLIDHVMALLPFEPALWRSSTGHRRPMSVILSASAPRHCGRMPPRRNGATACRRSCY